MAKQRVHISGAGPVGMVVALNLCREGIPVTVLEAGKTVCKDMRAPWFHSPTVDMLEDIGYLDRLKEAANVESSMRFSDHLFDGEIQIAFDVLGRHYRNPYCLNVGQQWFTQVGFELLQQHDCEFLFEHEVLDATQNDDRVDVRIRTPNGEKTLRTEWLIGCDGGSSNTRRSQGIEFDGYTWEDRFLLIHTRYDFEPYFGRLQYISNADDWRLIIKIPYGPDEGDWLQRMVCGVRPEEHDDDVLDPANLQEKLQGLRRSDTPYEIENAVIYNVHQRVAKTYRKNRVLLAGDAAHLNNPMGGQGLNCGIHDAINLAEKFVSVWRDGKDDALLDVYDRQRRQTNWEYIQAITVENKKRNEETDPAKRAATLGYLRSLQDDDDARFEFLYRWSMGESLKYAAGIN